MIDLKHYQQQPDEGLFEKIQRRLARRRLMRSGAVAAAIVAVAVAVTLMWPVSQPVATVASESVADSNIQTLTHSNINTVVGDSVADAHQQPTTVVGNLVAAATSQPAPAFGEPVSAPHHQPATVAGESVAAANTQPATAFGEPVSDSNIHSFTQSNINTVVSDPITDSNNQTIKQSNINSPTKSGTPVPHYDNIIWAPNVIVPDGDVDENRTFSIKATSAISSFTLQIYNRRGMRIYSTNDPSFKWDATYNGSKVPQGAYVWIATFRDTDGTPRNEKGSVVVDR